MKISQLVDLLENIKEEYGDIEVCCWPYDGQERMYKPTLKIDTYKGDIMIVEIDGV